MKPTVLVTDSLFIFPDHEAKFRDAGFEVERLDKPNATEDELIAALKDKVGYILGGTETVTAKVIESTDALKVIAFTGAGFASHIDAAAATAKGIAVTNTPGTTTFAVAEMCVAMILLMQRHLLEVAPPGDKTFMTVPSLADVRVGIVGMGRIGERTTRMLLAMGVGGITYWNRHRKEDLDAELGITYASLEDLCASCDVVSYHAAAGAGAILNRDLLEKTKDGTLFVNVGGNDGYDADALYDRITKHNARAAFDVSHFPDDRFKQLPMSSWWCTNANAGFNTRDMLQTTSDMATRELLMS